MLNFSTNIKSTCRTFNNSYKYTFQKSNLVAPIILYSYCRNASEYKLLPKASFPSGVLRPSLESQYPKNRALCNLNSPQRFGTNPSSAVLSQYSIDFNMKFALPFTKTELEMLLVSLMLNFEEKSLFMRSYDRVWVSIVTDQWFHPVVQLDTEPNSMNWFNRYQFVG